jgi:hypothetical protein
MESYIAWNIFRFRQASYQFKSYSYLWIQKNCNVEINSDYVDGPS